LKTRVTQEYLEDLHSSKLENLEVGIFLEIYDLLKVNQKDINKSNICVLIFFVGRLFYNIEAIAESSNK
jgi:hypothetical protein